MRPLRFIFSLALLLISGTGAWAQSAQAAFERGEAAYQRKDYANALALWLPLAQQRHSLAQYNIAYMYQKGLGTPPDAAKACAWFSQAAALGDTAAVVALGHCYATGQGAPQDLTQAANLYQLAATVGDAQAQYLYAQAWERGLGVPRNNEQALQWYYQAASNGVAPAQQWLKAWAAKNSTQAPTSAAMPTPRSAASTSSHTVPSSLPEEPLPDSAMAKLLAAAAQGDRQAQYEAGVRLSQGRGSAIDLPQGVRLLRAARRAGHPKAQEALDQTGFGE